MTNSIEEIDLLTAAMKMIEKAMMLANKRDKKAAEHLGNITDMIYRYLENNFKRVL